MFLHENGPVSPSRAALALEAECFQPFLVQVSPAPSPPPHQNSQHDREDNGQYYHTRDPAGQSSFLGGRRRSTAGNEECDERRWHYHDADE